MKTLADINKALVNSLRAEHTAVSKYARALRKQRDELIEEHGELIEEHGELTEEHDELTEEHDKLIKERNKLLAAQSQPTETQPTQTQYVLHGDIQPCTVLYSDDTTTLLRLDEGDVMCETDTVEWYDEVTYRCQELLKSVDVRSLAHVVPRLAQLVRDERILLNDNGDDASPVVGGSVSETKAFTYARYVGECFVHGASPMSHAEWEQAGRPHFTPKQER